MAPIPERGYPLSALFLLMAACAIPMSMSAAAARAVATGDVGQRELIYAALVGSGAVLCLGMIVGLHHYRPALGMIAGGAAGGLIGSMAGPMALAPRHDFSQMLLLSTVGSAVLVLVATSLRAGAMRRRALEPPAWLDAGSPFQDSPRAQQ